MNKNDKAEKYTPYKISAIMEQLNALNTFTGLRDFGTGEKYHTTEIHIMSYIAQNPGITISHLARNWNRTKGAMSQIIKRLENKDLIYRQMEKQNHKNVYLYVTEKGRLLDLAHQRYDNENYADFFYRLCELYSEEKIYDLFECLETWMNLILADKNNQ